MKIHINWTPELRDKLPRATALYRTANDNASSPEEVKTANKQLQVMARSLGMSVAKLRSACEQHIDSEAPKPKRRSGNSYTPSPKATKPKYANPEVFDVGLQVRVADGDAKLYLHNVCIATLDPGQWLALAPWLGSSAQEPPRCVRLRSRSNF